MKDQLSKIKLERVNLESESQKNAKKISDLNNLVQELKESITVKDQQITAGKKEKEKLYLETIQVKETIN